MHTLPLPQFGVVFHYNGDFSGNVIIQQGNEQIAVPFTALAAFVAEYVKGEKISRLQQEHDCFAALGVPVHLGSD